MLEKLETYPKMKFIYAEMSFFSLWWNEISQDKQDRVKKWVLFLAHPSWLEALALIGWFPSFQADFSGAAGDCDWRLGYVRWGQRPLLCHAWPTHWGQSVATQPRGCTAREWLGNWSIRPLTHHGVFAQTLWIQQHAHPAHSLLSEEVSVWGEEIRVPLAPELGLVLLHAVVTWDDLKHVSEQGFILLFSAYRPPG